MILAALFQPYLLRPGAPSFCGDLRFRTRKQSPCPISPGSQTAPWAAASLPASLGVPPESASSRLGSGQRPWLPL